QPSRNQKKSDRRDAENAEGLSLGAHASSVPGVSNTLHAGCVRSQEPAEENPWQLAKDFKLRVRARISWHFGASAGQADARRRDAGDVLTSSRSGNAADAGPPPRPAGLRLPRPANYCGLPVMIQLGMGAAAKCHIILARALSPAAATELALVLGVWSALATLASKFFFTVYLPGYLAGLGLCYLQGHYEHVRGTTSHYGSLYNLTFFNDGYHVEHHERPGEHWRYLPRQVRYGAPASPWPPVLRWLAAV